MYFENIDRYADFCPKLTDYKVCNNEVACPITTIPPRDIDTMVKSKYNTMDFQW